MFKTIKNFMLFGLVLFTAVVLISCQPTTYTVTFDTQDGSPVTSISVEEGMTFQIPDDPTREGYLFAGWYVDSSFDTEYHEGFTVNGNTTIYARWDAITYTVSFETNGGSSVSSQVIHQGLVASEPVTTMEHNIFAGWYLDEELTTAFDFETPITSDMTVYAKWMEDVYTLTFNTVNGSNVPSISGVYGTTITQPEDPYLTGYTFAGWYTDDTYTTSFSFDAVLEADVTAYAKWLPINYTLTFETAGGTSIDPMVIGYGETITVPNNPTLEGATFAGWYTNQTYYTMYNFTTMPAKNVTVYAKWDMPDEVRVSSDIADIDIPNLVTRNIDIGKYGEKGTNFTWTFSSPDLISNKGEVVLAPMGSGGIPVTIILDASYGSYSDTKVWHVTVDEMMEKTVTSSIVYDFIPLSDEYIVDSGSIELFFVDHGTIPYVDVATFLSLVDGAIESVAEEEPVEITDENGDIWYVVKDMVVIPQGDGVLLVQANSTYTPMVYDGEGEEAILIVDTLREVENNTYEAVFDFTNNTYYSESYDFFDSLGAATSTDFGDGLVFGDTTIVEGHAISIPFNDYRIDLIEYDDTGVITYLMPLYLANLIFVGEVYYDVYFNGDTVYGVDSYQFLDGETSIISQVRTSSKNTQSIPLDLRIATYDYLALTFDYFYGLKEDKGVTAFYDEFLPFSGDIIFGSDAAHYNAIFDLTYSLDDLHTYHIMTGYYTEPDYVIDLTSLSQLGPRSAAYYQTSWDVDDFIEEANRQPISYTPDGKTAVIVVDEFTVDTPGDFDRQLRIVQDDHPEVVNIVIDLSNNGGGNVGAVWRMFGYMTENPFYYHSMNPAEGSIYNYEISSTYVAYDYHWYILISPVTFSAANLMAAMAKEAGIATIIGIQSSGGASSISGKVLPTGDVIFISSNNVITVETQEGYESVEYGVTP